MQSLPALEAITTQVCDLLFIWPELNNKNGIQLFISAATRSKRDVINDPSVVDLSAVIFMSTISVILGDVVASGVALRVCFSTLRCFIYNNI